MKYVFYLGATLGLLANGPTPGRFAPPRLELAPPGQVDLGELGPLETRLQRYRVSNTSTAPITLRLLDLAPGVTVAGPALERPIPARGTAELVLTVDPAGWVGPQVRNVRLGTDDPGQGRYYLPVRMTVRPDLTVDGVRRTFGDVGVQESPLALFRFARDTGARLRMELASELPPYLECEVEAAGARASLAFILRPGRVPPGMRLGLERVQVASNAPLQPRFDLYLEWRIHHAIEAVPARVVFQEPGPDVLELRLKSRNGTPFRILGAELEGGGFQVGPVPPSAGADHILTLRRITALPAKALLTLRCSGVDEPLRVPLAYVSSAPAMNEGVMVVPTRKD
jgi:hypothetical protein